MKDNTNTGSVNPLKIISNSVNARIMILLKRHPMSPRDLSKHLGKDEADIVRRLRLMQKCGLVKSAWGSRLSKTVKLYSLAFSGFGVNIQQDGIKIDYVHLANVSKWKTSNSVAEQILDSSLYEQVPKSTTEVSAIVGRKDELRILHQHDLRFIFIVGVAGVGKTSLAKKFASEYLSMPLQQKDEEKKLIADVVAGQRHLFWHTFKEIDTLAYLLGKLAAFLSKNGVKDLLRCLESPSGTDIHGRRTLVAASSALDKFSSLLMVFDDYHKIRDEKISVFIGHLLDQAGRSSRMSRTKVLILSRSEPPFYLNKPYCKELALSGLTLKDAKEITDLRLSIGDQVMAQVWKRYAGHPMALNIFSLFARGKKNQQHFKNDELLYKTLSIDELLNYFQREIFGILDEDELNMLISLSVFRMPVGLDAFRDKRMFRMSSAGRNMNYVLHSLQKKMLISRDPGNQKIFLHDMLRDALYSMLLYPADLHASAAQYYLHEGSTESIVECMYHLARCGDVKGMMYRLEDEVVNEKYGIIEQGYAAPLLDILAGLEDIGARKSKDKVEAKELVYLRSIEGKALSMMQRWKESYKKLEEAITIARNLSDRYVMAYALKNYGETYYLQGKLDIVEEKLLEAAEILQTYKHDPRHRQSLKNVHLKLARLYFITGKHEKSKVYSEKAKNACSSTTAAD